MRPYLQHHLDKYIHLHTDCLPVPGAVRTAIYDLTRREMVLIPTEYMEVLRLFRQHTLGELLEEAEQEGTGENFLEFLDYLLENEMVLFLKDTKPFIPLQEGWEYPARIQNAIIDIKDSLHDFRSIINQLDGLGCTILQLRGFSPLLDVATSREVLRLCYHTSIEGVELIVAYEPGAEEEYLRLMEEEMIISTLTIHSAPYDRDTPVTYGYKKEIYEQIGRKIRFTQEVITSEQHCGIINAYSLISPSVSGYMELKKYNGCLNRKIAVDHRGEVRNCPSMPQSYGHINEVKLKDVVNVPSFKEKEGIKKDQVSTCRDCEYRYACTDCRAYVEDPEDLYSKPLKCGYDPYTGEWSVWTENPLKHKAAAYYKIPMADKPEAAV